MIETIVPTHRPNPCFRLCLLGFLILLLFLPGTSLANPLGESRNLAFVPTRAAAVARRMPLEMESPNGHFGRRGGGGGGHVRTRNNQRLGYSSQTREEHDASRSYQSQQQQSWKSETVVMPIVIMDAILPGQTLHFTSPDPKFDALINYVLSCNDSKEIGIIGVDPPTKHPLYVGVTAPIVKKDIVFGIDRNSERVLATSLKGSRRFKIVGEPWMDPTESFYIGQVKILDSREEPVPLELQQSVSHLHSMIPALVNEWVESLIKTEKLSPAGVTTIIKGIGPMPSSPCDRAMWVGALLNPILPLGFCQEIRPAMLLCQNDYDRLVLATVALRSTVDSLLRGKD